MQAFSGLVMAARNAERGTAAAHPQGLLEVSALDTATQQVPFGVHYQSDTAIEGRQVSGPDRFNESLYGKLAKIQKSQDRRPPWAFTTNMSYQSF